MPRESSGRRQGKPEGDFQKTVIEYAQWCGWRVAHFKTVTVRGDGDRMRHVTPVAADGKGYPDLTMVRDRLVIVECKSEVGRLRPEQLVWLEALGRAGVEVHVWKPSMWPKVLEVLR